MRYASFLLASVAVTLLAGESFACNRVQAVFVQQTTCGGCQTAAVAPQVTYAVPVQSFAVMPSYAHVQAVAVQHQVVVQQRASFGYGGGGFAARGRGRANFGGGAIGGSGLGGLIGDALPLAGAGIGAAVGGPFGAVLGAGAGTVAKNLFGF